MRLLDVRSQRFGGRNVPAEILKNCHSNQCPAQLEQRMGSAFLIEAQFQGLNQLVTPASRRKVRRLLDRIELEISKDRFDHPHRLVCIKSNP